MKKNLCGILIFAMVFTLITMPTIATATDSFSGDYFEGDTVIASFDASNTEDLSALYTADGSAVQTTEFGDGKYAHAPSGGWLFLPQICPALSESESVYVKFRIHAIDDNNVAGKVVYMYTKNSGSARASRGFYNSHADAGVNVPGNRILANADAGVDVIFELTASGHSNYVKTAGSDEDWVLLEENKTYSRNNSFQALQIQYGLGVSSVVVYKKQAPELESVNRAENAEAMKVALTTYASELGIDLTKLDEVTNPEVIFESLIDIVFYTPEEVVAAFDEAVATLGVGKFEGDYSEGDLVIASFDASNGDDMDQIYTLNNVPVQTTEFGDGTYAHAPNGDWLLIPQISPALSDTESVYVKYRIHAIDDNDLGKVLYQYTKNSGNRRASRTLNNSEIGDNRLLVSSTSGVDVIFEMKANGHSNYVRTAGSDEEWTLLEEDKGYSTNSSFKILQLQYGLGISEAVVYKKLSPEVAAINVAAEADAEAMRAAIEANYEALGIDLSLLADVDPLVVYAKMLNKTYATAEDVVAAFEAAIPYTGDYVEGEDKIILTLDTSTISTTTEGATIQSVTYGDDTYVYANGTNAYATIPVKPTLPTGEDKLYLKFRTHATDDAGYAHTYMYFNHSGTGQRRITGNFNTFLPEAGISFSTASVGIDNVYEITATGYKHYARPVGSDEGWVFVREGEFATGGEGQFQMGGSMGISSYFAYTKLDPRVKAINEIESASDMQEAIMSTYSEAIGTSPSDLEGVADVDAVFEKMVEKSPFENLGDIREKLLEVVAAQKAFERVLSNPSDILAENDKVYLSEPFDAMSSQISIAGDITVSNGEAYSGVNGDLFLPVDGGMKGKIARIVFKPDNETTLVNIMCYDVYVNATTPNRYYKSLRGLPNAWHEAIMYAYEDTTYLWYRNIDANGAWQALEPGSKSIHNTAAYVGIRLINNNGGVTYDEVIAYNDLYSDYSVKETGGNVDVDGKLYYSYPGIEKSRNAQVIFSTYNKKYGYTSAVDLSESKNVVPATEEVVDKTYTYNPNTETYAVMLWDSTDTGIILGKASGFKTPNKLGDFGTSTLEEGTFAFARHFNDCLIEGNMGEEYVDAPVAISVTDPDGTVVAAAQTTTNLKGAFAVNVGIDAENLEGGTYTVKVTCRDLTDGGAVELSGTELDYNSIDSAEELVSAIEDYVDAEITAFFNQPGDMIAYGRFLRIKDGKDFENFFEFKAAVDEAVSYTTSFRELRSALNTAVSKEKWSDVMNLITVEYRELLELPTNPTKGISNEKELFRRMIKDDGGQFIVYDTAEEIVDVFNDALAAQKLAEKATDKGNGGGSGGGGGGGSNLGFGKDILQDNKPSQEKIEEMIDSAEKGNLTDISSVSWAADSIVALYNSGIVSGDGSGYFYPNNTVKREEFLKMIVLAADIPLDETGSLSFSDVDKDAWYFVYVNTAYKKGIINGMSETEFGIGENITRADMAVIMKRVLDSCDVEIESVRPARIFDDYEKIPSYAGTSITTLYMAGIVEGMGDNLFAPEKTATRAEAAVIINRCLQLLNNR